MTATRYRDLTKQITSNLAPLRASAPQVMKSFAEMGKAAIADGALDAKTKELIALAIGVATRCDGCIGFHAKALARLGGDASLTAIAAEVDENAAKVHRYLLSLIQEGMVSQHAATQHGSSDTHLRRQTTQQ